jgi:hypothetical protein
LLTRQFFYKNGVPKWRGTGYYYSRYRPTLLHTLTFLIFLTSLFHFLILKMNYARDKKRVDYFEQAARTSAGLPPKKEEGGSGATNGAGRRRKVKVPMVAGSEFSGQLELIVDGEEVFIVSFIHLSTGGQLTSSLMEMGPWSHCRI